MMAVRAPVLRIAHVGDIGSSRDITHRAVSIHWISKNITGLFNERKPKHDFIDLSGGRDFLTEKRKYDLVILHYLYGGPPVAIDDPIFQRGLRRSPVDSVDRWRKRLGQTGADVIIAFGGSTEIARIHLGNIDGYKAKEVFYPVLDGIIQFAVWRKASAV